MDDIDALLDVADQQLAVIRSVYEKSLQAGQVPPGLQTLIKNLLENQRSALDFLAERILDKHGSRGPKTKAYYPIARTSYDFPTVFARNLPGVRLAAPDVAKAISERQHYRPGYDWLKDLVELVNENKHRESTPQTRVWKPELEVDPPPGTSHIRHAPGVQGASDARIQTTKPVKVGRDVQVGQTLHGVVAVDWLFTKPNASALATLERIQNELRRLVTEVRQVAGV